MIAVLTWQIIKIVRYSITLLITMIVNEGSLTKSLFLLCGVAKCSSSLMAAITCVVGLHFGHIVVHFKVGNFCCFPSLLSQPCFEFTYSVPII